MSINSILSGITGISDGGRNTASEIRIVLTDMATTLSAETDTLDSVTTRGNVTTNTIDISGVTTQFIDFDTNQHGSVQSPGHVHWNANEDTLEIFANGVTYQIGQEIAPLVTNKSGSIITNGTPVMFAGTLGNTGRVLITPARADGLIPSSFVLGVTTQDIANQGDGHVTWFGKIRDIDTSGSPYGEVWADEDILYVSPTTPGFLTNVKPQAPNPQIFIGVVINAHATSGVIFTRPSWRGLLSDLDEVFITGVTNGQYLVYNSGTTVWENSTLFVDVPSASGATGTPNQIAYDSDYLYICTATNTWKRTGLSDW